MYLAQSFFFDFDHQNIQNIISDVKYANIPIEEKSIILYQRVRDRWKYNPNNMSLVVADYRASHIATKSDGNCVEKSILLIACLRAVGIPARLHLGKVKNHIAAEKLIEKLGSDELSPHGMANAQINGKWLKMSPVFDRELCAKFKVDPLEFDGKNDSFLQQFNKDGDVFMEYIDDYGYFDDVPFEFMIQNLKDNYPKIFNTGEELKEFSLS